MEAITRMKMLANSRSSRCGSANPGVMLSTPNTPPSKISLCDWAKAAWPAAIGWAPVISSPAWVFPYTVG
jgi:hypothetical protein